MIKYENINIVLNAIPNVVREDTDQLQLIAWANEQYRNFELPFKYELAYALIDVENHKAILPTDVHRILDVLHSNSYPDTDVQTVLRDYGDYRLIIAQEIFFSSPYVGSFKPIKYKGQNRNKLIDERIYCKSLNCEVGFSIDARMKCLTIDLIDGEVLLEYFTTVKDTDGNPLIPYDTDLINGLAAYAVSKYWENKAYAHEERGYQFYLDNLNKATILLNKFRGKSILRNIDVEAQRSFLFNRNRFNYSNNNRQYRFNGRN